jgi:hypothetical protein
MMRRWITGLACLGPALLSVSPVFPVGADAAARFSSPDQLNAIVQQRLSHYSRQYSDIQFIHLKGGDDWYSDFVAVVTMLGHNAVALDYEHPPELAADVMELSFERLKRMLMADVVSATAFKVGQGSSITRPKLCVITLNPKTFVASDRTATQYMLDLTESVMAKVNPARYLNHRQHLEFTVDHEVFHCLDSILLGGAPMTKLPLGGEYHLFRRESAADAYAMALHLKKYGRVTNYARNMTHARALWMFTDSPNRCTFETVREVLITDPKQFSEASEKQLLRWAKKTIDRTVRDYHGYVHQRAAALQAASTLGMDPELYGENWCDCAKIKTEPRLVAQLVNRYRYYYEHLFTDERLALDAPPLIDSLQR